MKLVPLKINRKVVLASKSPRRQQLLTELGIPFEVIIHEVNEDYPPELKNEEVALYLAAKKASAYNSEAGAGCLIITADTTVCLHGKIINKPTDRNDAVKILQSLSGKTHTVTTAVSLRLDSNINTFFVDTDVTFRDITKEEINYYIAHYSPFDKAGAYGIQEWIGLVAIQRINGSYHNVMGLPVGELYEHLKTMDL
jgi:nucleoside triphosphate pyrophosphatase